MGPGAGGPGSFAGTAGNQLDPPLSAGIETSVNVGKLRQLSCVSVHTVGREAGGLAHPVSARQRTRMALMFVTAAPTS